MPGVAMLLGPWLAILACTAPASERALLAASLSSAAAVHASAAAVSNAGGGLALAKPLTEALMVAAAAGDYAQATCLADHISETIGTSMCSKSHWFRARILLANAVLVENGLSPFRGLDEHQEILRASLQLPMDAYAGWACAYWVAAKPSEIGR